ncbi:MAG: hypothetical protein M0Q23_07820 [Syntrophales bacterium]|jgi:polyhydroxyalkanoate synthesis regulator phasin|nr:hypothetical protein [Syntrophales bacterium]MCK9528531.1 hypothetical protein [Syntrophales bacterium]MDX9922842.1 hypothetical protein [Syntrophales bacterium]
MDSQFLEFWGQSLLNLARGQRRLEELSRWMSGTAGGAGTDRLIDLFRTSYGLDKLEKDGPEYLKLFEKASRSYQQSLREYLSLFNVVPRDDMEALQRECDALKATIADQEKIIGRLKNIIDTSGRTPEEATRELKNLLEKQTLEFQKMMKTMGQAFVRKETKKSRSR